MESLAPSDLAEKKTKKKRQREDESSSEPEEDRIHVSEDFRMSKSKAEFVAWMRI